MSSVLCVKFVAAIFTSWCAATPAPAVAVKPAPPPVVAVAPPAQPLPPPSKHAAADRKHSGKNAELTEVSDRPKSRHHAARERERLHHHVQHYSTPAEYRETRALNAKSLQ